MLRIFRASRFVAFFGMAFLLWTAGCRAQDKADDDSAAIATLVQSANEAVSKRDSVALKSLTDGDTEKPFAWVKVTLKRDWKTDTLRLANPADKTDAPYRFIIFHRWHTCESDGDHVYPLVKSGANWKIGAEIEETETGGYRVRDHNLTVKFDIPQKSATIKDTVLVERVEKSAAKAMPFVLLRLSEDYRIGHFTAKDDKPIPCVQVGGIVAFVPPSASRFTLKMEYAGKVEHQESDYIHDTEATLDSYWYPHIARLPATATVTVTAPAGWTPIAQGEMTGELTETDGSLTRSYKNTIPTCYFTVDAGKYFITTRKVGRLTFATYLLNNNEEFANKSLDTLEAALPFFSATFSPYPYSHYTLVETTGPFAGALEAYSFATFGAGSMRDSIRHELSHTWWGGIVPCAYTKSMWNEAFAEYSDDLCQRVGAKIPEKGASPLQRMAFARGFRDFTLTEARDTDDERQTSVGYGKGPLVLRALEEELGLPTMEKCLAAFVANHPHGEAADWPEFEAVVKKVSGKEYRWFWTQWMEQTGLPVGHLENATLKRDGEDYLVEADFVQASPAYRMKLPLVVETQEGPIHSVLEVESAKTHITVRTKTLPTKILADPNGTLPLATPRMPAGLNALSLPLTLTP